MSWNNPFKSSARKTNLKDIPKQMRREEKEEKEEQEEKEDKEEVVHPVFPGTFFYHARHLRDSILKEIDPALTIATKNSINT